MRGKMINAGSDNALLLLKLFSSAAILAEDAEAKRSNCDSIGWLQHPLEVPSGSMIALAMRSARHFGLSTKLEEKPKTILND